MKNKLIYLGFLLFILVIFEMGLRLSFPVPEIKNFNRSIYQVTAGEISRLPYLRNIDLMWRSYPDTIHDFIHELNTYGFRDEEWKVKREKGRGRLMIMGDSFVEGMMSEQDQTIPSFLESQLNAKGRNIEVMNAGMMGIGLNEYMAFAKDAVPLFKPDQLILLLFANDAPFQRDFKLGRKFEPIYFENSRPRLLTILDEINTNAPIPFDFSPERRPFHEAVPSRHNPWTQREAELSPHVQSRLVESMKKGEFNFYRFNWILEEEKFLKTPIDMKEKLRYIKNVCDANKCRLSIYYIPSRAQVTTYYYQYDRSLCLLNCPDFLDLTSEMYNGHSNSLSNSCQELRLPFYDLTPLIKREEDQGNHLYWNYDDHMKAKGYLLVANEVYNTLSK